MTAFAELVQDIQAFLGRHPGVVARVSLIGRLEACKYPDLLLHFEYYNSLPCRTLYDFDPAGPSQRHHCRAEQEPDSKCGAYPALASE